MPSRKNEVEDRPSLERLGPKKREPHRETAQHQGSLEELIETRLFAYVDTLQGHFPRDLYALIMPQLERPLLRVVMTLAEGRPTVAASMLGIHRNTLRAKLRELDLEEEVAAARPPRR